MNLVKNQVQRRRRYDLKIQEKQVVMHFIDLLLTKDLDIMNEEAIKEFISTNFIRFCTHFNSDRESSRFELLFKLV